MSSTYSYFPGRPKVSPYVAKANEFLVRHSIELRIELLCRERSSICVGKWNNRFEVTLTNTASMGTGDAKSISFEFHGSVADYEKGVKTLSSYDVLACCSGDINCPETFEDFCAEYGYDIDSCKAENTFRACLVQARKLRKFFNTETMRNELAEIN